jgi:RNA polymerase sigma-70 factor (ECF subfamily)
MFEAVCSRDPSEPAPDELALLVGHLHSGDGQALETLYEASIGKLYALALAMLRNAEDAEEVVCETDAQAWETAASFDPRRGSVMGWLLMRRYRARRDHLAARRGALMLIRAEYHARP